MSAFDLESNSITRIQRPRFSHPAYANGRQAGGPSALFEGAMRKAKSMTKHSMHFGALALLIAAGAYPQVVSAQANSPVAYVYVSRPTHVDGFAASASGKLTPVPGSSFSNISVSHMSVTSKFLFGAGDDNQSIYSFSIAKNGALKQVGQINAHTYIRPTTTAIPSDQRRLMMPT